MKILEVKFEFNTISVLQELCVAHKWPIPYYEYKKNMNGIYIVFFSHNMCLSKGEAKTKQGAKTKAARLMYKQVKILMPVKVLHQLKFDCTSITLITTQGIWKSKAKVFFCNAWKYLLKI